MELALVGCFGFRPALAATPTPLTLEYRAPAGCPRASSVQGDALRLAQLGQSAPHQVLARLTIRETDGGFELTLRAEVDGVSGERRIEGRSCRSVTDAAALTLALMLNPAAELPASEPASDSPPVRGAPERTQRTPVAKPPARARDVGSAWPKSFGARASLGIHSGVLPDPGVELMAGPGVGLGPLSAWLLLGIMPAQTARIDDSGSGGDLWALTGSALLGWHARLRWFRVGPVLGVELLRVSGEGTGVSDPESASIHWTAAMAGLSADFALGERFWLSAAALGVVPLSRPSFFLEQLGPVHQPEAFGLKAYLGATWGSF